MSQADVFDSYVRTKHAWPDVLDVDIFCAFKIEWFAIEYNAQGFLQPTDVIFQDGSAYSRGGIVDNDWLGG